VTRATFEASDYAGTGPENYERFFVPAIGAPMARDLVASASIAPGERVLDVACGTGVVARLAAERTGPRGSVAGLDVNPGMLSVARSVTPRELAIEWYEASAEAMPLPDASYDVVLCQMGLQFMPDKRRVLEEIRRILAPGGRVVLNLPGPTPAPFAALARALARHIDPGCAGFVHAVFSLHDADELRALVSDAGFSDVALDRSRKALTLPAPQVFLWQYIHSTPLAALVEQATADQRQALQREVTRRWQELAAEGGMRFDIDMTTVRGRLVQGS
jgi:ubiquinone/menaquinone biosynthesis C-methylase UbiE